MEQLKTFDNNDFGTLEVITIDGKEFFPATQCAEILGYKNPHEAIRTHCKEQGVRELLTPTDGGQQKKKYITEGNLYRLIVRSTLPAAEKFEMWIMDEVLPSIRKTGAYSMTAEPEQSPVIKRIQAMESMIADYWRANDEQYMKLRQEVSQARFEQLRDSFREFKGKIWLEGVPPELLERIDNVFMEWSKV